MKRMNLVHGMKVNVTNHALEQYLVRANIMSREHFNELLALSQQGDTQAKNRLYNERKELEAKFRNSSLSKFLGNNKELRHEVSGSMNRRCKFVALKKGNSFIVLTAYLQGKKNNLWKQEA